MAIIIKMQSCAAQYVITFQTGEKTGIGFYFYYKAYIYIYIGT